MMLKKQLRKLMAASIIVSVVSGYLYAEKFHIVIFPDTQIEASANDGRFASRTQWVVDNKDVLNIQFVLAVGDVVNWETPQDGNQQYIISSNAFNMLNTAGVPYVLCIGNHDTAAVGDCEWIDGVCYDLHNGGSAACGNAHVNLRNTSTFNAFFPLSSFDGLAGVYEAGKIDNAYHTFRAGGLDWLIINLELWPRTGAIEWAKEIVEAYPDHNVIFVTHMFIYSSGYISDTNGGYGDNSPRYMFDNLVKQYENVRMVVNGHNGGYAYTTAMGVNGNTIHLFNQTYHDWNTNPMRLLEIDTTAGTMSSRIYCPYTDEYKYDYGDYTGSTVTVTGISWVPVGDGSSGGGGTSAIPVILDVGMTDITQNTAVITWATDVAATSRVEWGTLETYGSETAESGDVSTSHSVTIAGLQPGTLYHFRVKSRNDAGTSVGTDNTFETTSVFANVKLAGNVLRSSSDRVRFEGLNASTELNIYTLSGELVAALNESDFGGGAIDWTGINNYNVNVKPGVYIYVLTDVSGNRKSGKVVIGY